MKLWIKSLLYSLPIWIFFAVDKNILDITGRSLVGVFLYGPGMLFCFIVFGPGKTLHFIDLWIISMMNCIVYYFLVMLVLFIRRRTKMVPKISTQPDEKSSDTTPP